MQTSMSLKINANGSDYANIDELKSLQSQGFEVVMIGTPSACQSTLIILDDHKTPPDKTE